MMDLSSLKHISLSSKRSINSGGSRYRIELFKRFSQRISCTASLLTGLRIGELQALYWSEIEILDDEHGKIHVNSSWGKTERLVWQEKQLKPKSSKRIVPFTSARLVHLLKLHSVIQKRNGFSENSTGTGPIEKRILLIGTLKA